MLYGEAVTSLVIDPPIFIISDGMVNPLNHIAGIDRKAFHAF
jgi:hypothetical protein